MKRKSLLAATALTLGTAAGADSLHGAQFLSPNDFIRAIDTDPMVERSDFPDGELPAYGHDGFTDTKYLNFAETNSGLILTPGASIVQGLQLFTANDAEERDPTSWKLWGTNGAITTPQNGTGLENEGIWTLISESNVTLPSGEGSRQQAGPIQNFANTTSYSSYRLLFPTVRNAAAANSMQIGDIQLLDNSGFNILSEGTPSIGFAFPQLASNYPGAEAPINILDGAGPRPDLGTASNYPAAESPALLFDGTAENMVGGKYLNSGGAGSGFIVTPAVGAKTVKSFTLTTANDAVGRDPTSWQLFGTNQAIASADNSLGNAETWTLVGSGALALPADRNTLAASIPVANNTAYSSYKMIFPTVVGSNLFQLGEASFFESSDGTGADILNPGDAVKAIHIRSGLDTKYLNFGATNSGFIVTPAAGAKAINGFRITTANDATERDPASYELYGTNDAITTPENGQGTSENWTLISSGNLTLPDARRAAGDTIAVTNTTEYSSYKLVFKTLKTVLGGDGNPLVPNSMQIAGVEFFDASTPASADADNNGIVDGNDFLLLQRTNPSLIPLWRTQFGGPPATTAAMGAVPEPATAALAAVALAGAIAIRRRKA